MKTISVSIGPSETVLCNDIRILRGELLPSASQSVPAGPYFATTFKSNW